MAGDLVQLTVAAFSDIAATLSEVIEDGPECEFGSSGQGNSTPIGKRKRSKSLVTQSPPC
jgi:hypothetical protein